jgi:sphinganine-1-phosphate aldolase
VEARVQRELGESMASLRDGLAGQLRGLPFLTALPPAGWSRDRVVTEARTLLGLADYKGLSGVCHRPGEDRVQVVTEVLAMAAYTNPLNPDAYPGLRKMEAEVVRMTGELFHAGPGLAGSMTSGGTESLILAVLAYRGHARARRGVHRPNLVMATTGHVGVDKAVGGA